MPASPRTGRMVPMCLANVLVTRARAMHQDAADLAQGSDLDEDIPAASNHSQGAVMLAEIPPVERPSHAVLGLQRCHHRGFEHQQPELTNRM